MIPFETEVMSSVMSDSLTLYSTTLALGDLEQLAQALIGLTVMFFWFVTILVVMVDKGSPLHKVIWMLAAIVLPVISLILYFCLAHRTRRL